MLYYTVSNCTTSVQGDYRGRGWDAMLVGLGVSRPSNLGYISRLSARVDLAITTATRARRGIVGGQIEMRNILGEDVRIWTDSTGSRTSTRLEWMVLQLSRTDMVPDISAVRRSYYMFVLIRKIRI